VVVMPVLRFPPPYPHPIVHVRLVSSDRRRAWQPPQPDHAARLTSTSFRKYWGGVIRSGGTTEGAGSFMGRASSSIWLTRGPSPAATRRALPAPWNPPRSPAGGLPLRPPPPGRRST